MFDWGVQETWLLSEFCDKGNLDRAVSGGRFHDKATAAPEMVRTPKASQQYLLMRAHVYLPRYAYPASCYLLYQAAYAALARRASVVERISRSACVCVCWF